MGENRFFYVEAKSFEIAKNAIELSLIERSRNHVSFITMGFAAALWLRDVLLEVTRMSNDNNLFRSFREGNKIFVLQKQRNGKGRFVTITTLGDSKSKGYVIIPEGRGAGGWQGASQEITNIMDAQNHGTREINQRWPQPRQPTVQGNRDSNLVKESRTFKEAVTQGDTPNLSLEIAGNQGAASQLCNVMAKDTLELSIKILLSRGPSGGWDVQWAGVVPSENAGPSQPQTHVTKPFVTKATNGPLLTKPNENSFNSKTKTQPNNPKPKMVWQPRVNGCDSESQLSETPSLIPAPPMTTQTIEEACQEIGEVDRSWGSSRDWFLDLRDGRTLRIPVDLRSPVTELCRPEDAITQKLTQKFNGSRRNGKPLVPMLKMKREFLRGKRWVSNLGTIVRGFYRDVKQLDLLRTLGLRGDEGEKDLVPLNVEPLAVAFPDGVENHGGQEAGIYGSQPSDWVQRRQKAIGKVLGANYEGYEQAVIVLLMDIEARHLQRKARGILLMWDSRIVEKLEGAVGYFSVSCKFKNVEDHQVWMFTGVYGPNINSDRRLMWDELAGIRSWWDVPWCLGGDFNVVRFPAERVGSTNFSTSMHEFSDFISSHGLIDIPLTGGNFTWSNNREISSMSRIDRFLYSADWAEGFIRIIQKRLDRLNSNHFPVALECGTIQRSRCPFRFENMWLMAEGFVDRVRAWNINVQKKTLLAGLRDLDVVADTRPLSAEEKGKREQLAIDLEKDGYRRPYLEGIQFDAISAEDALWIERPFEETEIESVVQGCNGDKAPGPDGFSLAFFQNCWSIVRSDVLGDFRPISLVGGMYKIIAKLLANRLATVLRKIISPSQSAFVKGRQILNSVLIANECLDSRLKTLSLGVICKLDLEKAYDHVNWDFLIYLLRRCGFSEKWRKWIYFFVSSVRFSILVNGSPCGFFPSSSGIRQGDPLSPMLFVIIMEAFSRLIGKATRCLEYPNQLFYLHSVLIWFEATSGLQINLGKSELVPVGVVPCIEELADILGCKTSKLPIKYLGLPLGAKFKAKDIWNPIIEKMERRLAADVAHQIKKIQRNFLWGTSEEVAKFHLVNWNMVCSPYSHGGLAIKNLRRFNEALLGKWLWRFGVERDALWRKVIIAKYGALDGGWMSKSPRGPHRGGARWLTLFNAGVMRFIGSSERDKMCWKPARTKGFQVKSFYTHLTSPGLGFFPWKSIWKAKVPPRVTFFVWTAALGKILTADNLRRRGIPVVSWCCMCKADGETVDHLLLHCSYAKELWDMVFGLFGIQWVMPKRVIELLYCWIGSVGRNSVIWKAIPHCIMWCLWQERNARTFEDCELSVVDLKLHFYRSLLEWMSATGLFKISNMLDFIDYCSF
uniref:Reverse transcriptase domain-containing protein n=1 Tax=Fagus sylvatica TaxID=28930 RepID=A0A2N9EFL4_FAGSY